MHFNMLRSVDDELFEVVGDKTKRHPPKTNAVQESCRNFDPETAVCFPDTKISAESAWYIQSSSNPNHKIDGDALRLRVILVLIYAMLF